MRDHVIKEITEQAVLDGRIYLITGDLGYAVLDGFRKRCPERYINAGIAEQNMTALAAGMAKEGNIVFTYSIGNFPTLRCMEQIRNDVCYHNLNVKILAVGGGFVYGNQGVTHHATEDIAMMRVLPNMRVYVPGDAYEAVVCVKEAIDIDGPAYIRLARNKESNFHEPDEKIDINRILPFSECGRDVNILTCGSVLSEGMLLKEGLKEKYDVGLFSVPRIKPVDGEGIRKAAEASKLLVTMEDHQITGGLGGAAAEILAEMPNPHAALFRVGLRDTFSDMTGDQKYIREYYGISGEAAALIIDRMLGERVS